MMTQPQQLLSNAGFWMLVALAAVSTTPSAQAYNILGIFPTHSKSHYIAGGALMKGLAAAGHNVTVISPYPQAKRVPNFRDIEVLGVEEAIHENILKDVSNLNSLSLFEATFVYHKIGLFYTNFTLKHPVMQEFLARRDEHFDLVICEITLNEAMLGIAQHFNAPIVGFSSAGATMWTTDVVGTPTPISYVPNTFLAFTDRMTFTERVVNAAVTIFERLTYPAYLQAQSDLYDEVFAADVRRPTLDALRRNVSLVLLNQHFTLNYPRPYVPNMIEVGGLHISRAAARPLPADIAAFIEGATDGVIYFSLGSNVRSSQLPVEVRDGLLRTFAAMRERVLWKWEEDELPGKPANVLIRKWFPQDDVLAHPKVKLFITHGGLLSTTESIYHGVPLVGVPVFGDQYLNMQQAENRGYGVKIAFSNLTETSLRWALAEVLGDEKYTRQAREISRRYRDQPLTPLETAIYWVEYVIRHGGAQHIRSAGLELSAVQYHSLDVFAFMAFAVGFVLYIIRMSVLWLVDAVRRRAGGQAKGRKMKKK